MSDFFLPFNLLFKFILNNCFDLFNLLMISIVILICALLTGQIKKILRLIISSLKSTYKISLFIILIFIINFFGASGDDFTWIKKDMELVYYFEVLLITFLFITLYHLLVIQSSRRNNLIFLLARSITVLLVVTLLNYIIFYINNNADELGIDLFNNLHIFFRLLFTIVFTYIYLVNDTIIYIVMFVLSIATLIAVFVLNNDDFNEEGIKKEKLSINKNISAILLTVIIYLPVYSQLLKV